jgi:hypothetical protein
MTNPRNEQFSEEETKRRFEAALRGARLAETKPMKDIPPKRPKSNPNNGHHPQGRQNTSKTK